MYLAKGDGSMFEIPKEMLGQFETIKMEFNKDNDEVHFTDILPRLKSGGSSESGTQAYRNDNLS